LGAENIVLGDFGEVFVVRWDLRLQSSSTIRRDAEIDVEGDIIALGRLLYEIATLEPAPEAGITTRPDNAVPAKAAERGNQGHYWPSEGNLGTLVMMARRAMDRRMVDQFRSVKDFQIRVDAFKDTFDDPKQLTLRRLLRQWIGTHKIGAVLLFLLVTLATSAFAYLVTEKVMFYRALWEERTGK
jgi:hypothetical protein